MSLVQELHETRKPASLKEEFITTIPADIAEAIASVEEWVAYQKARFEGVPVNSLGPTIKSIHQAVALHYGISINDIVGSRKGRWVSFPRMVAAHLARRLTTRSYPEIGKRFGGRDHTTILYSDRKITKMLETDVSLRASVEMLIEQLGGERT